MESSVILIGRPPNKTFGAIELNYAHVQGRPSPEPALDVVIKMELVRMGAQADGINLIFSLVV